MPPALHLNHVLPTKHALAREWKGAKIRRKVKVKGNVPYKEGRKKSKLKFD